MLALIPPTAAKLALDFLLTDLEIPAADRDFFTVLGTRETGSEWYAVDIGVEGLPDRWVLQVFDTGQCDPCYTFVSPMPAGEDADLAEFPLPIAQAVATERART